MKNEKLGILNIALVYVGTIMGAGFASGREIWQFFGVFGNKGYIGVGFVGILFIIIGIGVHRIIYNYIFYFSFKINSPYIYFIIQ